jgi:hypothetical protein
MVKNSSIYVRIEEETKKHIEAVARSQGKSLTTFVVEAATKAAAEAAKAKGKGQRARGRHTGVPTYFRAHCFEASRGGESNYSAPGYHLTMHLSDEMPYDMDADEWEAEVNGLRRLLAREDDAGVWRWFHSHFPKCMELVPARRRAQFIQGVRQAFEENRVEI